MLTDQWQEYERSLSSGARLSSCEKCWIEEDLGFVSRRQDLNNLYNDVKVAAIHDLEIALDFGCNMMCWACRPRFSTKWAAANDLVQELNSKSLDIEKSVEDVRSQHSFYKEKIWQLINNTDLSSLRYLRLVGGEPLLSPRLEPFLNLIEEKANPSQITLMITTNSSVFPSAEVLEKLSRFKTVEIRCSVDAVGELAELIRPPSPWQKIEGTFKEWAKAAEAFDNIDLGIHCTLSLLNLERLHELLSWFSQYPKFEWQKAVLRGPEYLIPWLIPLKARTEMYLANKTVIDAFELANVFLAEPVINIQEDHLAEKSVAFLDTLSAYHGASFEKLCPVTYGLLQSQVGASPLLTSSQAR